MLLLSRQSGSGGSFQLSCAGHELAGVVAAKSLIPGKDWAFPYYRDQGFPLGLGCDLSEIFASFLARTTQNHSAGTRLGWTRSAVANGADSGDTPSKNRIDTARRNTSFR